MLDIRQPSGKVAVVTGGASGIGKAIANRLIGLGMTVIVADIERPALERAAREIGAEAIAADVTSFDSVKALADEVIRRFGRVDLFCSNAGVGSLARIADMQLADWSWLLGVNLWGAIHGIKAFLPLLSANPDGAHLAVTASEAGFHATPGLGGYCVSKSAVVALCETLAQELEEDGSNVGVTILCPGPVRSRLGSSQRNRPSHSSGALTDSDLESTAEGRKLRWIDASVVSDALVHALEKGHLYAFTHPEMAVLVEKRIANIAEAFRQAAGRADAQGCSGA
ncbi:MAG TPA: SDR family NAD(P)-dependent oxidoreductase [Steroidobacteraceae bacterium]|nr:SDR family NAD(P)-dependent oxidoreductase [Steroidobacteraceae bacterium]